MHGRSHNGIVFYGVLSSIMPAFTSVNHLMEVVYVLICTT